MWLCRLFQKLVFGAGVQEVMVNAGVLGRGFRLSALDGWFIAYWTLMVGCITFF
jgi:hypothetical protein